MPGPKKPIRPHDKPAQGGHSQLVAANSQPLHCRTRFAIAHRPADIRISAIVICTFHADLGGRADRRAITYNMPLQEVSNMPLQLTAARPEVPDPIVELKRATGSVPATPFR